MQCSLPHTHAHARMRAKEEIHHPYSPVTPDLQSGVINESDLQSETLADADYKSANKNYAGLQIQRDKKCRGKLRHVLSPVPPSRRICNPA